jgi:glucan phosphoethanolaminetransferase (alkaline phosphatase superfamily)
MYELLAKRGQLFAILLGVVGIAVFLGSVIAGLGSAGYDMSSDLNAIMKSNPDQQFNFFNPGLMFASILIVVAAAAAIIFGLIQTLSTPKESLKVIVGIAVMVGLFFLLYSMSNTDFDSAIRDTILDPKFGVTEMSSKLISGGLKTTLILGAVAVISMILFEIYNFFK